MTAPAPANLRYPVAARLDAARWAGDRVAYADALTSLADLRIYEAAYHGVPLDYVDPSSGWWSVPENICRTCWDVVAGPVVALGCEGWCLHYHPDCRPRYADLPPRPLDILYPAGRQHPRRSCRSQLPHYVG